METAETSRVDGVCKKIARCIRIRETNQLNGTDLADRNYRLLLEIQSTERKRAVIVRSTKIELL